MRRFLIILTAVMLTLPCFPAFSLAESVDPYQYLVSFYNDGIRKQEKYEDTEGCLTCLRELMQFYEAETESDPSFARRDLASSYYDYAAARVEMSNESPDWKKAEDLLRGLGENDFYRSTEYMTLAQGMREIGEEDYYNGIAHLWSVQNKFKDLSPMVKETVQQAQKDYREKVIRDAADILQSDGRLEDARAVYNVYLEKFPADKEMKEYRDNLKALTIADDGTVVIDPSGEASAATSESTDPYKYLTGLYDKGIRMQDENQDVAGCLGCLWELTEFFEAETEKDPSFATKDLASVYYDYAAARVKMSSEYPDWLKAEELLRGLGANDFYRSAEYLTLAQGMRETGEGEYYSGITNLRLVQNKFPELAYMVKATVQQAREDYREKVIRDASGILQGSGTEEDARALYDRYLDLFPTDSEMKKYRENLKAVTIAEDGTVVVDPSGTAATVTERSLTAAAVPEENAMTLQWTDTAEERTYTVTLCPENGNTPVTYTNVTGTEARFEGLIPGTVYTAAVTDAEDGTVRADCSGQTPSAAWMQRDDLEFTGCRLMTIGKNYLKKRTLQELAAEHPELFTELPENAVTRNDTARNVLLVQFDFESGFTDGGTVQERAVLRSEKSGTWQTEPKEISVPANTYRPLKGDVQDLLEMAREGRNSIPADVYTYELYIDGELCGNITFSVSE